MTLPPHDQQSNQRQSRSSPPLTFYDPVVLISRGV